MRPGGTTEIICHFAGYLHLHPGFILARPVYELGGSTTISGDLVLPISAASPRSPEVPTATSAYSAAPDLPDAPSVDFNGGFTPLKFSKSVHHPHDAPAKFAFPPVPPLGLGGGGGDGSTLWPDITIEYGHWAPQRLIYAEQLKFMVDNDKLLVPGGADPGDLHGIDVVPTLADMLETALANTPDDLDLPLRNQNATAESIHDRDSARAEEGPPEPPSIENGVWIDNELQPPGASHPALPAFPERGELPDSDGTVAGLSGTLGSNVQANLAEIIDVNEAGQTLVVLGDYFETNAIVQTNIYQDNDQIAHAGPADQAVMSADVNQAHNIAEFIREEAIEGGGSKAFGGPGWHVDVLDGDFLDVKTLVQQNWMMDNDVTVQTTSGAYARVLAGQNTQVSLGSYFDLKYYDVIIVSGDYHEANLIFQTNILLDDDILQVAADLGPGHDEFAQMLSWNGNTLLNDATISNLGAQDNLPVSDEMLDLVDLLGEGTTTDLDSSFGWMFSGNGTGELSILYVTGDYYDINVVTQINVLSDIDTAIQYLPDVTPPRDDERASGDALQQSASSGDNMQVNSASIVDVGTLVDQHIGGDYYEDTILIQANIIAGDDDEVTVGDTTTLVPELIAFTGDCGCGSPDDSHHEIAPVKDILTQSDVMGNVLN